MTTIEYVPQTVQPDPERPVFLAENGRRARIFAIVAKVAVALTALWLAALAAGMLGFGHLPGAAINEPFSRLTGGNDDATKQQTPSREPASVTATGLERSAGAPTRSIVARRSALAGAAAIRARSPQRPRVATAAPAQPATGQAAVAQQPRQQGWTRQGYVAPPGQIRTAQLPATPPAPPGNAYGQVKKTTPPPPPPPPPGNGNGNSNGGGNPQQQ
jgi:hypothetical protein